MAPGTINVRLAAVRRLAYKPLDAGLLSPELAAGMRRVKGAKKLGMRLGNWLTVEEARCLWQLPNMHSVKGKRDRAILAVLLGCGLRRRELIDLTLDHIQRREDHWAIVDLVGKENTSARFRCPIEEHLQITPLENKRVGPDAPIGEVRTSTVPQIWRLREMP